MPIEITKPATSINYRNPTLIGLGASMALTALVIVGSRNLEHFDSALFGYLIASIVAFGAIFFRYALWLQRPATRAYFSRGLKLFFQRKKFARNTLDATKTVGINMLAQKFIFKRAKSRWLMHFLIMWGCILSAAITFPLVWGWIHFKLESETGYKAYVFGFPMQSMDVHSVMAFFTFKALNFTALMVLAGCAIAIHRRLKGPRSNCCSAISVGFCSPSSIDRDLCLGAYANGIEHIFRWLYVLVHCPDTSSDSDNDAFLPTVRQAVSYRPAPGLDRR
ncbi:MAG: hypothetical protein IPG58_19615 [Acidobacteria bacterium]|nr:hypothetical protein [Acidobacteriota bacterium]